MSLAFPGYLYNFVLILSQLFVLNKQTETSLFENLVLSLKQIMKLRGAAGSFARGAEPTDGFAGNRGRGAKPDPQNQSGGSGAGRCPKNFFLEIQFGNLRKIDRKDERSQSKIAKSDNRNCF